jgi:cadmium resistance transport/sequestration family protein
MNSLLAPTLTGIVAFVATNIDDLVILTLFFAQVERFRWQQVVAGQYLGMIALVLLSLPGYFGGLVVSKSVIGLLGFVPIAIGLSQWFKRKSSSSEVQTVRDAAPTVSGEPSEATLEQPKKRQHPIFHPQTYSVAAVTFANGGDNIGTYVPLFATSNAVNLLVILGVFFLMVGIWCYLAFGLTRHPFISSAVTRYGDALVPIVLIGLGIYILVENGTVELLKGKGL